MIGKGSFGDVYLANSTKHKNKLYSVKIISLNNFFYNNYREIVKIEVQVLK